MRANLDYFLERDGTFRSAMLAIPFLVSTTLVVGSPARVSVGRVETPRMIPKFEIPNFDALTKIFAPAAPEPVIEVTPPSAAITAAGKVMPLLGLFFQFEAILQAFVTNLGPYDEETIQAEIRDTISSSPVVIYTYPLSPFSTEAVSVIQSTGCNFKNVELGLEWFALGPKGSATRVELRKMFGQGSLPHIFIGGEWVGGLATGAEGGLAGLVERDELVQKLKKAKAF